MGKGDVVDPQIGELITMHRQAVKRNQKDGQAWAMLALVMRLPFIKIYIAINT